MIIDKIPKNIKRLALTYCVTVTTYAALVMGGAIREASNDMQNITRSINFVNNNLEDTVQELEELYDIQIDDVNVGFIRIGPTNPSLAIYVAEIDSIFIAINKPVELVQRSDNPSFLTRITGKKDIMTTKGILQHEIGHDYSSQVRNKLKEKGVYNNSWDHTPFDYLFPNKLLVEEGIAEYFSIESGENLRRSSLSWPTTIQEFIYPNIEEGRKSASYYSHGYEYIKPILDELGVEEGITRIYSHAVPSEEEILNPELYRERIMNVSVNEQ